MDSLGDNDCWDFLENIIDETPSSSLLWPGNNNSGSVEIDFSCSGIVSQQNEPARKRARGGDSCSRPGAKACREKLSRERLNHRFQDLTVVLYFERPFKLDKPAIIDDVIRLLNQQKS
ncbi:Transcription factor bHLH34 [Linum perenne]